MAVTTSQIQTIINDVTQEVEKAYAGLSLCFVTHQSGKIRESIALAEHEVISHPAGNAARTILRKHTTNDQSSFLGLAITTKSKMMGFKKTDHLLGLFNVNINEFENLDEARAQIYHLAWHAIDLYEIRQQPQYRNKFKKGPMIPKRSPMNAAKAFLQADVFAISLSALRKENDLLNLLSSRRAHSSLEAKSNFKPEDFPSTIAMDICKLAIDDLTSKNIQKEDHIQRARKLSIDVGHTFDEENIRQWWNFTIPAQDMAWRGFSKEQILGAAIHTSSDPFVRSIGFLIQGVTHVEPVAADTLKQGYNAFIDPEILASLHKEMVDTIFEDAIIKGLEESSNRPFLNAANSLNEALTEGHILGWCSNALQDAAHAFERALLNGAPPDQAARMQFEGNKSHPKWETLKEIGKDIVDQKRQGFAITMGHIAEVCHNNAAFAPVLDSLKITLNDPNYIQTLEASNDLNVMPNIPTMAPSAPTPKGPAPKGPAPKGPAPNTPTPQAPAMGMGPSLGGGGNNNARHIMYQKQLATQKAAQAQQQGTDDKQ